mgnify:CR=1 FL=1
MTEVDPAALSSLVVWGAFSLSLLLEQSYAINPAAPYRIRVLRAEQQGEGLIIHNQALHDDQRFWGAVDDADKRAAIRAEDLPGLRRLAQSIQAKGAKAVLQIHHGGFRALPHLVPANGVVAPSAFTLIPPSFSFDIEADKRLQSEARVLTDAEIRDGFEPDERIGEVERENAAAQQESDREHHGQRDKKHEAL